MLHSLWKHGSMLLISSPANEHKTLSSLNANSSHVGTPQVDTSLVNDTPHTNVPVREDDNVPPRRSGRSTRQPSWLDDYVTEDVKVVKGVKKGGER